MSKALCGTHFFTDFACSQFRAIFQKNVEKKSILEYISDRTSTTDFTNKINFLVEQIMVLIGLSINKISTLKYNINFYE